VLRCLPTLALLLLAPGTAAGIGVTGTVVATPGFGGPEAPGRTDEDRSFYWEVPNGIVPTVPYRVRLDEQVVVTLQGVGLEGDAPGNVDVQIGGPSMVPQTVVAAPGSQLRFINHSGLTVELFGEGAPTFAPEPLHTAHMRIVPALTAGTLVVRCGHHPNFRGWVVVAAGKKAARVAADGTFSFPDVPPGTYTLEVHFRGQAVVSRSVRVVDEDVAVGEIRLGTPEPPPAAAAAPSSPAATEAQEEPSGRRGGRRGRGGGGGAGRANAGGAAASPAGPAEPRLAPGELRPHRLSGGP